MRNSTVNIVFIDGSPAAARAFTALSALTLDDATDVAAGYEYVVTLDQRGTFTTVVQALTETHTQDVVERRTHEFQIAEGPCTVDGVALRAALKPRAALGSLLTRLHVGHSAASSTNRSQFTDDAREAAAEIHALIDGSTAYIAGLNAKDEVESLSCESGASLVVTADGTLGDLSAIVRALAASGRKRGMLLTAGDKSNILVFQRDATRTAAE